MASIVFAFMLYGNKKNNLTLTVVFYLLCAKKGNCAVFRGHEGDNIASTLDTGDFSAHEGGNITAFEFALRSLEWSGDQTCGALDGIARNFGDLFDTINGRIGDGPDGLLGLLDGFHSEHGKARKDQKTSERNADSLGVRSEVEFFGKFVKFGANLWNG